MFGLGSNGLRFSPDEIYQLAHLQGITSFSDTEARKLAETFDGWITGILLGTRLGDLQSFHSDGPTSYIWEAPAIRMSRQRLFAYLVNEVFSREPEIYAFLKDCSIFQKMLPDICNNFLAISNALENLNYLEQQGLFVTHNGEGSAITFTCHPVLRELLCEELCTRAPEHFYALHSQAAKIFYGIHDYDQAIYHALQSTDNDFAALLIEEAYTRIRDESFPGTVAHWINELPIELIHTHPGLLLLNANIYLSSGDYTNALPLLDKATALIKGNNLSIHFDKEDVRLLKARISLAQSRAFFLRRTMNRPKMFCRATLPLLSADEIELRADIHLRLEMCALRQGDFIMGIKELQQALQLRRQHVGGSQIAQIYSQLANAYHMIGNDALSEHYRTRALSCWDQLHDETGKVNNLIAMGVVLQRKGIYAEAELQLTQALKISSQLHFSQGEAYALVSLGDLYLDQGKYERTLTLTEDGLNLAQQLKDYYLITYASCTLAITYFLMGDSHTALLLVSQDNPSITQRETITYTQAVRILTYGTILLYQDRCEEALSYLTSITKILDTNNLKREQLQVLIRIAACHLYTKRYACYHSFPGKSNNPGWATWL